MSAFVVSKDHIDLLVTTALHGPSDQRPHDYPGDTTWYGPRWFDIPGDDLRAGAAETTDLTARFAYIEAHRHSINNDVDADRLVALLVQENVASVEHRYHDSVYGLPGDTSHLDRPLTHEDPRYRLTVAEAFAALDCYEYQSCEHGGWETSEAKLFCDAFRRALSKQVAGYAEAPWEWSVEDVASRRLGAVAS